MAVESMAGVVASTTDLIARASPSPERSLGVVIGTSVRGTAFVPIGFPDNTEFKKVFGKLDATSFGKIALRNWLKYSNGSFPFPALIHVHPRDLPISEIYAEEYCKNVISCFKEGFNYNIGYGGNLVDETGEHFHAAKLCCRLYEKDIEVGVLDEHPDVVRTFLSKHPNPLSFLRAQLKLMKK